MGFIFLKNKEICNSEKSLGYLFFNFFLEYSFFVSIFLFFGFVLVVWCGIDGLYLLMCLVCRISLV